MEEQRQPSSPEMAKFQLKDTIEALLKLTLTLSIEESMDLGLSKEFCSNLLKDDEDDSTYPASTSNPGIHPKLYSPVPFPRLRFRFPQFSKLPLI